MTQEPHYWYKLDVDIEPTDRGTLNDALEDEPFDIGERLGRSQLTRSINEGRLEFEAMSVERLEGFERDIGVLSVYLSQYIVGREVLVRPTQGAPILKGWMIVGRLGETVRLELDLLWDPHAEKLIDRGVDEADVATRWSELPEWARTALRLDHPKLRAL